MKVIKPSYEILSDISREKILGNIERYGRTCYKSEHLLTEDSASRFVERIVASGHHSVIEHESITVRFICDRGVSHELVRHRLASYSQESTRYCNYSKDMFGNQLTFILPCWFKIIHEGVVDYFDFDMDAMNPICPEHRWISVMLGVEADYKALIESGWSPQQARSILPNSLKTEIVMTCNLRNWMHVLELRTSPRAHPQIREIMIPLLKTLKRELPEIFEGVGKL